MPMVHPPKDGVAKTSIQLFLLLHSSPNTLMICLFFKHPPPRLIRHIPLSGTATPEVLAAFFFLYRNKKLGKRREKLDFGVARANTLPNTRSLSKPSFEAVARMDVSWTEG